MTLIFSVNNDYSTSEVIKWFRFHNYPFVRINEDDIVKVVSITNDNAIFLLNFETLIDLTNVKSVWYRRGKLNIDFNISFDPEYSSVERDALIEFTEKLIFNKRHINNFENSKFNKLFLYLYKNNLHFKIPSTIITTQKQELILFKKEHKTIISKPFAIPFARYDKNNNLHLAYTTKIDDKNINKLNDTFVPTLFQEYINKKIEIRSFFINFKFHSMCIFSQKNNNTKIDFRNYDDLKPNRTVPFKLEKEIERDLITFFKNYNLDSASIDIILDDKDNYYLIDINPIGQFGMVSHPCNYNLEFEIYKYLTT
jgi:ATP-GRASP peptide maturase of grasp-with-spasm system